MRPAGMLYGMAAVGCEIVRWVSDEPQPGIVEVQLTDAYGRCWSFLDKVAIFDADGSAGADSVYPVASVIACEVLGTSVADDGREIVSITTLRSWGVESTDGQSEFHVAADQLIEP